MRWKHAVVTGAGSGLGHGIAVRLLKHGVDVSAIDRAISDERRDLLDAAARAGGASWRMHVADVTQRTAMQDAVAAAISAHGPADLAAHFAGIGGLSSFEEMEDAEFYRMMDVNVNGSYHFARAVIPHLRPGDRLALTASMAGITSNFGYTSYGTSKFAVLGLATTLRLEYEPRGIHVSVICPPEIKTPMVESEYARGNRIGIEVKQVAGSLQPDEACDAIFADLLAGKWMIIPSFKGKTIAFMATRMPGLFNFMTSRVIRKVMKKHGIPVA